MNKSILSGRICTYPKIQILQNGENTINLCTFVISVTKDYEDNKNAEVYDFFECFCFGDVAKQIAGTYTKYSKVVILGKFKNFRFEDSINTKHFTNILAVECIEFGDTESYVNKMLSKKSPAEKAITTEYHMIDEMFEKICSKGFSVIDEADYYRLAMNLLMP